MGGIDLYKILHFNDYMDNVAEEYRFIANDKYLAGIYDLLTGCADLTNAHRSSYLFGFGKHPKSTYRKLQEDAEGYEVLWFGYNGPSKYKWLSSLPASTSGLVRVHETRCLTKLLDTLCHLAMVGVFSLSAQHAREFEKKLIDGAKLMVHPEDIIKEDASFFYWIIDGDMFDQEQYGFLCTSAFGKRCPASLTSIAEFAGKKW